MVLSCASIKTGALCVDLVQMMLAGRAWLPSGIELSLEDWARRHRAITLLAWVHAALLPVYGLSQGQPPSHVLLECSGIAVLAFAAGRARLSQTVRTLAATFA